MNPSLSILFADLYPIGRALVQESIFRNRAELFARVEQRMMARAMVSALIGDRVATRREFHRVCQARLRAERRGQDTSIYPARLRARRVA
jgi:hypothetical protein